MDADNESITSRLQEAMALLKDCGTGVMNQHQDSLPRLPIPPLEVSVGDFLRSCKPLLTAEEFASTEAHAARFLEALGPQLDTELREYEAAAGRASYLEDFWEDAYLEARQPIAVNTNPFFVLEDDPTPARTSQIARATTLVAAALKFCQSVRRGSLDPDMSRTTPLCMCQYPKLFGTTRIPRRGRDEVVLSPASRNMVVMSRGQLYDVEVFDAAGDLAFSEAALAATLRAIRQHSMGLSDQACAEAAVGLLTSEHRDRWADLREELAGLSEANAAALRRVDGAVLILNLDDTAPATPAQMAAVALHGTSHVHPLKAAGVTAGVQIGTCINRWYDKCLQVIVCQNGAAGINFEHSVVDGHTVLRFCSDVFTQTILNFAESIRGGFQARASAGAQKSGGGAARSGAIADAISELPFAHLEWTLSEGLRRAILQAEAVLSDVVPQLDLQVLEFVEFGKNLIVQHKLSPDAFVQIAMQVAYHRVYRESVPTYETLMTKRFFHGRTEAGFVVTQESKALCESFERPGAGSSDDIRLLLLRALDAHVQVVKLGSEGRGIRHLYALKRLLQRRGGAAGADAGGALLHGAGMAALTKQVISTSNCGNPALRLFGFGPVDRDGFGVGYLIKEDNVQFCATSRHRQTKRFLLSLHDTLLDFDAVLGARPLNSTLAALRADSAAQLSPMATAPGGHAYGRPGELSLNAINGSNGASFSGVPTSPPGRPAAYERAGSGLPPPLAAK